MAYVTYPKSNISEDYISAPNGPQIFTRARKWLSLTIAPPTGDWGRRYYFFQMGIKNWLKIK